MKKLFILSIMTLLCHWLAAQESQVEDVWNSKINFIVGGGPGILLGRHYDSPFVNRLNGNIHFPKSQFSDKFVGNLSLGISYTFFTKMFSTEILNQTIEEWRPHGVSAMLLFNPLSFTSDSFNSSANSNIGIGIGKKWGGGFAVYAVMDFLVLTQPKNSFVDIYDGTEQPYTVNEEIQYSFDGSDLNLFKSRYFPVVGIKLMYSLETFNRFKALNAKLATKLLQSTPTE